MTFTCTRILPRLTVKDCWLGEDDDDRNHDDDDDEIDNSIAVDRRNWIQQEVNNEKETMIKKKKKKKYSILMEIVGAMSLLSIVDEKNKNKNDDDIVLNPYCVVKQQQQQQQQHPEEEKNKVIKVVHKTSTIYDDTNPIWTIKTQSMCILELEVDEEAGVGVEEGDNDDKKKHSHNNKSEEAVVVIVDVMNGSKLLGTVPLTYQQILNNHQKRNNNKGDEREEYSILPPPGRSGTGEVSDTANTNSTSTSTTTTNNNHNNKAKLALRFRPATSDDRAFLSAAKRRRSKNNLRQSIKNKPSSESFLEDRKERRVEKEEDHVTTLSEAAATSTSAAKSTTVSSDINFRSVQGSRTSILRGTRNKKKAGDGRELLRVKPHPDPDRPKQETEWMTEQDMVAESLKPSKNWVSVGGGQVGKIYLEVIRCKGLPNMDASVGGVHKVTGDLTDPFVGMVFEDNMVRTNVIWDDLNPMWMPWSNHRAFVFNVRHPTSILMLGVFDFDVTPINYCDPIGRVVINTSNLQANTTYLLKYKLIHDPRQDGVDNDGKQADNNADHQQQCAAEAFSRGTITIRLRIEWEDEVDAVVKALGPPPRFIVNVENDKAYRCLRYLTRGAIDMDKPSMASVKMYANELLSYWTNYCYFLDVILGVFLWRGRLHLTKNWSIWFPIRSIVLFTCVALVLEYPHQAVAVVFYGIAWIMVSLNYNLSQYPSPWRRVKTLNERGVLFATGLGRQHRKPSVRIEPFQGDAEQKRLEKLDELKAKRMSNLIQALLHLLSGASRIYSKTSETSTKVTTEKKSFSLLPNLESYYSYPHMLFKGLCGLVRALRNIINWTTYSSQSLTVMCIWVATLWLVLPCRTISLWVLRVTAWGMLGPWMKLLDVYCFRPWYKTKEELVEELESGDDPTGSIDDLPDFDKFLDSDFFIKCGHTGRILAEQALKLKDMRELLYGSYGEVVPAYDSSRFPSVPLPESSAEPMQVSSNDSKALTNYNGQIRCEHVPGQRLHGDMIMTLDDYDGDHNSKNNNNNASSTAVAVLSSAVSSPTSPSSSSSA